MFTNLDQVDVAFAHPRLDRAPGFRPAAVCLQDRVGRRRDAYQGLAGQAARALYPTPNSCSN
ncbi:MAG: hypothetical protein ABIL01_09965 [Pseudomonadota bacterium]